MSQSKVTKREHVKFMSCEVLCDYVSGDIKRREEEAKELQEDLHKIRDSVQEAALKGLYYSKVWLYNVSKCHDLTPYKLYVYKRHAQHCNLPSCYSLGGCYVDGKCMIMVCFAVDEEIRNECMKMSMKY